MMAFPYVVCKKVNGKTTKVAAFSKKCYAQDFLSGTSRLDKSGQTFYLHQACQSYQPGLFTKLVTLPDVVCCVSIKVNKDTEKQVGQFNAERYAELFITEDIDIQRLNRGESRRYHIIKGNRIIKALFWDKQTGAKGEDLLEQFDPKPESSSLRLQSKVDNAFKHGIDIESDQAQDSEDKAD